MLCIINLSMVYELKNKFHRDEKRVCIYNVYYGITDSVLLLSEQNKESCYTISERVEGKEIQFLLICVYYSRKDTIKHSGDNCGLQNSNLY